MAGEPSLPVPQEPSKNWQHYDLWKRIIELLAEIPAYFQSTISVSGVNATELYSFGAVLGLTIEQEVVRTLNRLKPQWDSTGEYADYRFVRQPQTFPDVLLTTSHSRADTLLGIELKSWYLLSKEGEPSFRFTVTSAVCATQDLLVIVPWALSSVLSGNPIVFAPFVTSAHYMAEYRNYWWQHLRKAVKNSEIQSPSHATFYPASRDEISDKAVEDKGKNFGRIARLGIMDNYIRSFENEDLLGLSVGTWRRFFREKVAPEIFEGNEEE